MKSQHSFPKWRGRLALVRAACGATLMLAIVFLALAEGALPAAGADGRGQASATTLYVPLVTRDARVPAAYVGLYTDLEASVSGFQTTLTQGWDGVRGATLFSGELLPANGNLGDILLEPTTITTVNQYLDGLQAAGATGVGLQISYPMLLPDFANHADYLAFYQEVAAAVHSRGLTLLIESGPVFSGTVYSNVPVDYTGLTPATYFEGRRQMLVTIAQEIGPDYLSLSEEPDTEGTLVGLTLTEQDFLQFITSTVAAIGPASGVQLGAGTGSWSSPSLVEIYASQTDLDFINIHVYPVQLDNLNPLNNILTMVGAAQSNGKGLVVGESWLYKATAGEMATSQVALGEFYDRDVYSFWEPLDAQFMEMMATLAWRYQFDFVSFFWSRYLFAYLNYDTVPPNATTEWLNQASDEAAYAALEAGSFSAAGRTLQALTAP